MKQLLSIYFFLIFISVQGQTLNGTSQGAPLKKNENKQNSIDYTYKIIPSINNTWGYDINKGEKKFIHQINIPGMPGNNGFKAKSDAKKVARLVIKKLKNGEMPPSVNINEMKDLKIYLTN